MSEIIIYKNSKGDVAIDVVFEDDNIWLSQQQLCEVYSKARSTINEHIKNIYDENELVEAMSMKKFGNSEFAKKPTNYYNLDMIIALGYRVKSPQGTQFRIWATKRLNEYLTKGFVLDDDRFKSGNTMTYFDELQQRLRDIRISERFFYQKIKDIYTTSIDYDPKDEKTIAFFKVVQNKLLWAISSQTAAELVHNRVDVSLPLLGMQSLDKDKTQNIQKKDVSIAKNYLNEKEIKLLGLLVEQYLAFAETMAEQNTPMYMNDWIQRLDAIISLNGRELLTNVGQISHDMAVAKACLAYEQYKEEHREEKYVQNLLELEHDIKGLKKR
jgi:hypothetical protein